MRRFLQVLCLALIAVCIPAVASFAQYSDVRATFLASNPNDGWEYGFINEEGEFTAYNTTFDDGQGIAGWCLDNTPGPMGDVTINYSDEPISRYGVHWEPGQIIIHSPLPGMSSATRWCAPEDTTVRADAVLSAQCSDVNVNFVVASDGQELLDVPMETTAIPDAQMQSLATTDSNYEIVRSTVVSVTSGSTIDFLITSGEGAAPSHVSVAFSISEVAGGGISSKLVQPDPRKLFKGAMWAIYPSFDSLVERG